ncbi:MAG: hypothetical protein JO281_04115 [Pseudonocardiales bacterium]|nr:hypothetical protein [Pseudonocardiales bacterium]
MSDFLEDNSQRLARNINDLLQELRVSLVGVQILFGFLLSIVFTDAYRRAGGVPHAAHLVAVSFSLISMASMTAPAAWHRLLFRRRQRPEILRVGTRLAIVGLGSLAIAMSATIFLLIDVVLGGWSALLGAALTFVGIGVLWFVLPLHRRVSTAK